MEAKTLNDETTRLNLISCREDQSRKRKTKFHDETSEYISLVLILYCKTSNFNLRNEMTAADIEIVE